MVHHMDSEFFGDDDMASNFANLGRFQANLKEKENTEAILKLLNKLEKIRDEQQQREQQPMQQQQQQQQPPFYPQYYPNQPPPAPPAGFWPGVQMQQPMQQQQPLPMMMPAQPSAASIAAAIPVEHYVAIDAKGNIKRSGKDAKEGANSGLDRNKVYTIDELKAATAAQAAAAGEGYWDENDFYHPPSELSSGESIPAILRTDSGRRVKDGKTHYRAFIPENSLEPLVEWSGMSPEAIMIVIALLSTAAALVLVWWLTRRAARIKRKKQQQKQQQQKQQAVATVHRFPLHETTTTTTYANNNDFLGSPAPPPHLYYSPPPPPPHFPKVEESELKSIPPIQEAAQNHSRLTTSTDDATARMLEQIQQQQAEILQRLSAQERTASKLLARREAKLATKKKHQPFHRFQKALLSGTRAY